VVPPGRPIRDVLREMPPDAEEALPAKSDDLLLSSERLDNHKPRQRTLAISREAEVALLGAMLLDSGTIPFAANVVNKADMFAFPGHQLIFNTIMRLHNEARPIDLVVLRDELAKRGMLHAVGGPEYLATLVDSTPSPANAGSYAQSIRDAYMVRGVIETCLKIVDRAMQGPEDSDRFRLEVEQILRGFLRRC